MGGDEFVCLISDTDLDEVRDRFKQIGNSLNGESAAAISVGLVELLADETLEQLLHRGDEAMYAAKPAQR